MLASALRNSSPLSLNKGCVMFSNYWWNLYCSVGSETSQKLTTKTYGRHRRMTQSSWNRTRDSRLLGNQVSSSPASCQFQGFENKRIIVMIDKSLPRLIQRMVCLRVIVAERVKVEQYSMIFDRSASRFYLEWNSGRCSLTPSTNLFYSLPLKKKSKKERKEKK